jgi:hypothetical protein
MEMGPINVHTYKCAVQIHLWRIFACSRVVCAVSLAHSRLARRFICLLLCDVTSPLQMNVAASHFPFHSYSRHSCRIRATRPRPLVSKPGPNLQFHNSMLKAEFYRWLCVAGYCAGGQMGKIEMGGSCSK